jgi:hypothetical protein
MRLLASILRYNEAAIRHSARDSGAFSQALHRIGHHRGRYRAADVASVFITADTEPAKSPRIERNGQEMPTVHSRRKTQPNKAPPKPWIGNESGRIVAHAETETAIATQRRAS